MGPIEKKIEQFIKNERFSKATVLILENLKQELKPIEKELINYSYNTGYDDKEKGKGLVWDYYESKYNDYLKKIKIENK